MLASSHYIGDLQWLQPGPDSVDKEDTVGEAGWLGVGEESQEVCSSSGGLSYI